MENASKALLMAGGILIAIIILTIMVYLFSSYSKLSSIYETNLNANKLVKFNSNFTKFEGRKDITPKEIVSIINFVKEYKKKNEVELNVIVLGINYGTDLIDDFILQSKEYFKVKYFKCEEIKYNNGRVYEIVFSKYE